MLENMCKVKWNPVIFCIFNNKIGFVPYNYNAKEQQSDIWFSARNASYKMTMSKSTQTTIAMFAFFSKRFNIDFDKKCSQNFKLCKVRRSLL